MGMDMKQGSGAETVEVVLDRTKTSGQTREEQRGYIYYGCCLGGTPWLPMYLGWLRPLGALHFHP